MATKWRTLRCAVKLPETDETSSPSTVYQRRNFKQVQEQDEMGGGQPYQLWEFEERQLTRAEWDAMSSPAQQLTMQTLNDLKADIAFIGL